eukprot:3336760-Pyramimonas_sp.AAC.1
MAVRMREARLRTCMLAGRSVDQLPTPRSPASEIDCGGRCQILCHAQASRLDRAWGSGASCIR